MRSKSLNRTRIPVWRLQLLSFCHKYRTQLNLALGGTIAYVLNLPTAAQSCTGFMCGAKDGLLADAVISASTFMQAGINFMFLAANTVLAFVFLFGLIFIIAKLIERENYITPGIIFIVSLFGILIVNWATGYLFGTDTTGTGATTSGTGTTTEAGTTLGQGALNPN